MIDNETAAKPDTATPAQPKPEEMGRPVTGKGDALEPEAARTVVDGAVRAGDRMWGPAGVPGEGDTPKPSGS